MNHSAQQWHVLSAIPSPIIQACRELNLTVNDYDIPELNNLLSIEKCFQGKRFRPLLLFLFGTMLGLSIEELKIYARAAELVHAATLAHDDVLDNSPQRRGRPTLRILSSNACAILIGDLLLARVMRELSEIGHTKAIQSLSQAVENLVLGEWLQKDAYMMLHRTKENWHTVALHKTASLIIWTICLPAHLLNLPESTLKLCHALGSNIGIAFQMLDDILDFSTNSEKPFAQDFKEGLCNYVTIELLEQFPSLQEECKPYFGTTEWQKPVWTPQQLNTAITITREKALKKIHAAEKLLLEMYSLCHINSIESMHKRHEAYIALGQLLSGMLGTSI